MCILFSCLFSLRKMPSVDFEEAAVTVSGGPGNMLNTAATTPPGNTFDRVETRASTLYDSVPTWKQSIIVFTCSWGALTTCLSSTSLLSVGKEVSDDLKTTTQVVTFSSAGYVLAMGLGALLWIPIARVIMSRVCYHPSLLMIIRLLASEQHTSHAISYCLHSR